MDSILSSTPNIIGFIFISLFIFALIRELICWYFKINKRVKLMEKQLEEAVKTNAYLAHMSTLGAINIDMGDKL